MPYNVTLTPTNSARNLGVIFVSSLTFSEHISSVSKSCFLSVRDFRRIRNNLDFSTAQTIATSLIHSKVDYCNSLFFNLPRCQPVRLQLILNSAARAVSKTPRFCLTHPQIFTSAHNWSAHPVQSSRSHLQNTSISKRFLFYNLLNLQANTSTSSSILLSLFSVSQSTLVSK